MATHDLNTGETNAGEPNTGDPNAGGDGPAGLSRRQVLGGVAAGALLSAVGIAKNSEHSVAKPVAKKGSKHVTKSTRMPTVYLPHGGGPCFFMDWTMGPPDTWLRMAEWLRSIPKIVPRKPTALLVISAHWEQSVPTLLTSPKPPLLYDYSGFPQHTYQLKWPAPNDLTLATKIGQLLANSGIKSATDDRRGYDHGVFIPLLLAFPKADVPTVQLSLRRGLDPAEHLAIGKALQPLRDEGVLIIGSGMSYHNMRGFMQPSSLADSKAFDDWLATTVALDSKHRAAKLSAWKQAPRAVACHPREEHLLPLMVCAGAAGDDRGAAVFRDTVMGVQVSGHVFG